MQKWVRGRIVIETSKEEKPLFKRFLSYKEVTKTEAMLQMHPFEDVCALYLCYAFQFNKVVSRISLLFVL